MENDDTPTETTEPTVTEGKHASRVRRGRGRKPAAEEQTPDTAASVTEATPAAGGEDSRGQEVSQLDLARQKFGRMKETNGICFRFRNDFDRIEQELRKFNYTDAELDMILEPKGSKGIPGFSFEQLKRQEQYVERLERRFDRPVGGFAAAEDRRGEGEDGHAR